jgi:hypothetical protein
MVYPFDEPDEWCRAFLRDRSERIKNNIPYVKMNFENI